VRRETVGPDILGGCPARGPVAWQREKERD